MQLHARVLAIVGILICSAALFANDRKWQDAIARDIHTGNIGEIAVGSAYGTPYSVSSLAIAAPIVATYFAIEVPNAYAYSYKKDGHQVYAAGGMLYIVGCVRGSLRYRCPNVALNGRTKIAIDGTNAHILDDDGKDRKLPVIQKIEKKREGE
jgi:hypothetical protein